MRCFIAIDLPELLKQSLDEVVHQLKPLSRDVRWVPAGNLHLTLKFLGEVADAKIPAIAERLEEITATGAPFSLAVSGTGAFPDERRPHVLWAGVSVPPPLLALQSEVDETMAGLGFPKEQRRYAPHLTIGRVKGMQGMAELMSRFHTFQNVFFGSIEVHEIVLMQSITKPSGAVYAKLDRFRLRQIPQ